MNLRIEDLLSKLYSIEDIDDIKFYIFLYKNIIKPLKSGHLSLKFKNKYFNQLVELYELLEKEALNNKEIEALLKHTSLEMLLKELAELSKVQELDDVIYRNFINKYSNNINLDKRNKENMTVIQIGNSVIIRLSSFSRKYSGDDRSKFKQLEKNLAVRECENIIIDIRENEGGTDEYFELFSIFSNRDIDNCVKWKNLFTGENEGFIEKSIIKGTNRKYNIYVLMDSKVFSTAEAFVQMCKRTHFATLIGEETLGEGAGMTPLSIELNTKVPIVINFPIEAPINYNGEIDYEGFYSTVPDFICERQQALDIALKIIDEQKNNNSLEKVI